MNLLHHDVELLLDQLSKTGKIMFPFPLVTTQAQILHNLETHDDQEFGVCHTYP